MSHVLYGWELRARGGWETIDNRLNAYGEQGEWYIGAQRDDDRQRLYEIGWPSVLEPCGYNLRAGIAIAAEVIGCSTRLCRGQTHQYEIVGTCLRLARVRGSSVWKLHTNISGWHSYLWELYTTVGESRTGTRRELLQLLTELHRLDDGRDELKVFAPDESVGRL